MMDLRTIVVVSVLVTLMALNEVCARPSITDSWYHHGNNRVDPRNECEIPSAIRSEARELCQRCAKVTKSRLAYPMCCERLENTREWCIKFLNFGLPAPNSGD